MPTYNRFLWGAGLTVGLRIAIFLIGLAASFFVQPWCDADTEDCGGGRSNIFEGVAFLVRIYAFYFPVILTTLCLVPAIWIAFRRKWKRALAGIAVALLAVLVQSFLCEGCFEHWKFMWWR